METNFKHIRKLGLDIHCPLMTTVLQLHQLHQYHLDDGGVGAYGPACEEAQGTQTYSVYVVPAF